METTPGRSCAAASPPCASVYFNTLDVIYQNVCGMALGYATNSPDAFLNQTVGIDGAYLDGVSITYGLPRQHIWSLGVGHSNQVYSIYRCPCDNSNRNEAPLPPSFVGNNYFCDSDHINGEVWDGACTSNCCTFNNPPGCRVSIGQVRVCGCSEICGEVPVGSVVRCVVRWVDLW